MPYGPLGPHHALALSSDLRPHLLLLSLSLHVLHGRICAIIGLNAAVMPFTPSALLPLVTIGNIRPVHTLAARLTGFRTALSVRQRTSVGHSFPEALKRSTASVRVCCVVVSLR